MKWERIWAIVLRQLYLFTEINRVTWIFFWPLLDIVMFGFTGLGSGQTAAQSTALIIGVVLWELVVRSTFEPSLTLIEEVWSMNMLNVFASPLCVREWICAVFLLVGITGALVTLYGSVVAWFLYGVSLWSAGPLITPFVLALFISGVWLGFFSTGVIMYVGARAQALLFMAGWAFVPFSGALYPVSILPAWAQKIAWFLPFTYCFEGIRELVVNNQFLFSYLFNSVALSLVYLGVSLFFFSIFFDWSKKKGFARLMPD